MSGQLPLKVKSVESIGDVQSKNTYVNRDLGFPGRIGKHVFLSYGDTMWSNASNDKGFMGMTSDSLALATPNPREVHDVTVQANGYPAQFCPIMKEYGEDPSTDAMGITSVVEMNPEQGILFFAKNHRPGGNDHIVGAGVAVVTVQQGADGLPVPSCQRLGEYWWDGETEPYYGDVTALRAGDHVYAYGHAKNSQHVHVARVHHDHATDLNSYEYWNGSDWQSERIRNVGEKEGVFWAVQQGQMIWSKWYGCFVFIYCDTWGNNKVLAKVSYSPTGPFSDPVDLYQAQPQHGGIIYSPAAHDYFDETGQTLVITYTDSPNVIKAIKVTFE